MLRTYLSIQPGMRMRAVRPTVGTGVFAGMYFFARLGLDWLFRSLIPGIPMPPLWSVLLTQTVGTGIVSGLVFVLLVNLQNQREAMRDLNHGLRNALQVIAYVVPSCTVDNRARAEDAVDKMTTVLEDVSERLGMSDL
jgi:hypothetical protein